MCLLVIKTAEELKQEEEMQKELERRRQQLIEDAKEMGYEVNEEGWIKTTLGWFKTTNSAGFIICSMRQYQVLTSEQSLRHTELMLQWIHYLHGYMMNWIFSLE